MSVEEGKALGAVGMSLAKQSLSAEDKEDFYAIAKELLKTKQFVTGGEFMTAYYSNGFTAIVDKSWGGLINGLCSSSVNWMRKVGEVPSPDTNSHGKKVGVYESNLYSGPKTIEYFSPRERILELRKLVHTREVDILDALWEMYYTGQANSFSKK